MRTLNEIIINSNNDDEQIDNKCVDVFIKYLKDKTIIQSGIVLDSFVVEEFGLLGTYEVDYEKLSLLMKQKLFKAREKGRSGWWNSDTCTISHLYDLYSEHTQKCNDGNRIDICNFAMFIWFRENEYLLQRGNENHA